MRRSNHDYVVICSVTGGDCNDESMQLLILIFDRDKDGQLNRSEITTMLQSMVEIRNQTLPPSERIRPESIFYVGKNKFLSEMSIFILL